MEQPPIRTPDGRIWVQPDPGEASPRHADEPTTCEPIALEPITPDDPRYADLAKIAVDDDTWESGKLHRRSRTSRRLTRFRRHVLSVRRQRHTA